MHISLTSVDGTTVGPTFNTQTPNIPFTSQYYIQYKDRDLKTFKYEGSQWSIFPSDGTWGMNVANTNLEISVGMSYLGNASAIYVAGCIIDEKQFAELAMASFPGSFQRGYYPNITLTNYYGLLLTT